MTAKEWCKQHNPKLIAHRHQSNSLRKKEYHWTIREIGNSMYIATGKTEAKAWKAAKDRILEKLNDKK